MPKGQIAWNKGLHIYCGGGAKKGSVPWNKGKKCSYMVGNKLRLGISAWNKGKHIECMQGKKHPMWKGGKTKTNDGYIWIYYPNHPNNFHSYVAEHRLVVEKIIGRFLKTKEQVHHINKIKSDNSPKNLICFKSRGYHNVFHRWGYDNSKNIVFDGRTI